MKKIYAEQIALAWVARAGQRHGPIPGHQARTYLEEERRGEQASNYRRRTRANRRQSTPKGFASVVRYHDMSTVNLGNARHRSLRQPRSR